jgi:hypothetical protein
MILRINADYFLTEDQFIVLCKGERNFMCGSNRFLSIIYTNFMLRRALGMRLAWLGEITNIPESGPDNDTLKTGNQILCF